MAEAEDSIFSAAGFSLPTKKKAEKANGADVPAESTSLFKDAGFTLPTTVAAAPSSAQFSDENPIHVPGSPEYAADIKKYGVNDLATADTLENRLAKLRDAIDPINVAKAAARSFLNETVLSAKGAAQQYARGLSNIGHSMPGTGIGDVGLGIMGMATSPVAGAAKAFIGNPVTELTGNPDIGDRASALSSFLLPAKGATTAVKVGSESRAANALVDAVGPENVPGAVARLRNNPRLSLMDVSDPVRTVAQGLIDPAQPVAMDVLTGAVRRRQATLPGAVNSAYTEAMGPAPPVPKMLAWLKQRVQSVGKEQIEPALAGAKPADVSPVIAAIDSDLKPGLQAFAESKLPLSDYQAELARIKQRLTNNDTGETLTDPRRLHEIQSDIRAQAQRLLNSASGADRNLGSKLMAVRGKIVDVIDASAEGKYKPALKAYRDANQVDEAFDSGFDTLKNRSGRGGLEDRPEMFAEWMKNATKEEVVARRLGTRLDIDHEIRSVKNQALAGQNITAIEYNRDKLRMLFGKNESDRLISAMNDASAEAQTNAKLIAGSKTAETQAGQRALAVRPVQPFQMRGTLQALLPSAVAELAADYAGMPLGLAGPAMFALGAGGGLVKKAQQSFQKSLDLRRNVEFAKMASASGPERDRVINALMTHPKVVRALKKSGNALTSLPGP